MVGFGPETLDRLRAILPDDHAEPPDPARRAAGVLVPLFVDGPGDVSVVLTLRTDHLPSHAGQVSFPGGGWKEGDRTLLETALRESQEEIGLDPADVDVLGAIEDMPTAGSSFVIRPYCGLVPHPYDFVPDPSEVQRVLTAPLAVFADPTRRRTEQWERAGARYPVYFFDDVDGVTVWGATARILVALTDRIAGRRPDHVRIPLPEE